MKRWWMWWYRFVLDSLQFLCFKPLRPTRQPITFMIWRDAHLGDGLLTLPSLVRIRANFPNANLILLSHNDGKKGIHFKDYLADGIVDEIWDRSHWSLIQLVKNIRTRKITHLLALMPYSSSLKWNVISLLLVKFSGVGVAGGWKKETTFLAKKYFRKTSFPSEMERLDSLLSNLGLGPIENVEQIPIKKEEIPSGLEKGRLVIFAPFTKGIANLWPQENWVELGFKIREMMNLEMILVGDENDREKANSWIQTWGNGRFLHVTIPQLASLITHSEMVIGADSGVIHLANLLGKKNVALFGNSDYRGKWAHPENPFQTILYPSKDCTKCLGVRNQSCDCMNYLSLEAVLKAISSYG